MSHEFDYIVVGGGTAGVIVAVRLVERTGASVCLVESGSSGEHDPRVLEYRRWLSLLGSEYDDDHVIAPQERGNGRIRQSRARMLGGCSSHNTVIAFRPPDTDLRLWEQMGATGWGPENISGAWSHVRKRVTFETPPPLNACAVAFMDAAQQAGFPLAEVNSADIREAVVWLQLNACGPIRQSSAVAYLFPLEQCPAQLTVLTETLVQRVLINTSGEAIGIETNRGSLHARREVILCAGAFESPKLLMLSGIGPFEQLRRFDLPLHVDLAAVGEHLQDHLEATLIWEASRPVPTVGTQRWENGLFACIDSSRASFDMMMHFGTEHYYVDFTELGYPIPPAEHVFCMTPNIARPKSRGFVRLRSNDPAAKPLIDPRYLTDPAGEDERVLVEGLRLARRIAEQPALRSWVARELAPGLHIQSDEEIGHYVRMASNTVYHPCGTCRMGAATDQAAVVDPQLRVRGVERLRVADASVFPTMVGVNPCLTVMMIGERCAELIAPDV